MPKLFPLNIYKDIYVNDEMRVVADVHMVDEIKPSRLSQGKTKIEVKSRVEAELR